jgi:superfamily II DNA helicase RecQ
MMDQVRAAKKWGSAIFLGSAQDDKQAEFHLETYRFIFLAPEKLQQASIQRELQRISSMIFLFVVDEAHTQVTWQGFRPAFAEIPAVVRNIFGSQRPPLLMMTATLPSAQQEQLSQEFNLSKDAKVFRVSCDRDNLSIQIVQPIDINAQLLHFARSSKSKGKLCLIYVATPKECQVLSAKLKEADEELHIRLYHGAGSSGKYSSDLEEKSETLRLASDKKLDVCICTSAFGMGIDIPNIDCIIHLVPPRSLSEYAQQIGRAGRDGDSAIAVMMFHPGKISQCFSLWVPNKNPNLMHQNFVDFQDMMSFIYSSQCRRKFVRKMLEDVDESVQLNSACNCDTCEESHIIQRDVAPAMRLLLSAIKEHEFPVCISRISNALFAHAPKHYKAWDDTKSPMWGKGKALFAPTKQSDVWNSLAAVAVYELKFVVASLHSHQAPPMGHIVAYQRLALTPAGLAFLASDIQVLLVRERFVAESAWQHIPARCSVKDCTNKANGSTLFCSKHNKQAVHSEFGAHSIQGHKITDSESSVTDRLSQRSILSSQTNKNASAKHMQNALSKSDASSDAAAFTSQLVHTDAYHEFTSQPPAATRTLSQLTPPGHFTQQQQNLSDLSQRSLVELSTPPLLTQNNDISKKGSYFYDLSVDPNAQYNPYMGHTYTRVSGISRIKVWLLLFVCNLFSIHFDIW